MAWFALRYSVVPDYLERRTAFRTEHLALARASQARGELVLAGAFSDPPDGALLLFRADDRKVAEDFARGDPYVKNGLVTHWDVRAWTVVIGE